MSLCNIVFANYTISGAVQSEDGDPIKKGLITIVKESNGEEVDKTKISRKGKFKLKKINSGKYIINFTGDKIESKSISVMDDDCLLYTSPSPRDVSLSRMPSSA